LFKKWCSVLLLVPYASTNLLYRVKWKGSSPPPSSSNPLQINREYQGQWNPAYCIPWTWELYNRLPQTLQGCKTSSSVGLRDLPKWYHGILKWKTITPQYILVTSMYLYEYNQWQLGIHEKLIFSFIYLFFISIYQMLTVVKVLG